MAHFAQKLSRHEQKSDKARRNRNSDQS
jgi:hypothetical protein